MSKRQQQHPHHPLPQRLADFARSLIPTGQERALVAAILLSMLTGALVMHYRREYRLRHPVQASPTPLRAPGSPSGG